MADAAVIFDVDGVLLELTQAEEDVFFYPFEALHGLTGLSRDWDSYRIRNDEDIIGEVLERHFSRAPLEIERRAIVSAYLQHLSDGIANGRLNPKLISGAQDLLTALAWDGIALGIATANLLDAARIRLTATKLWHHVAAHAKGADGSGHKRNVLAQAIASTGLAPSRIVYIGDNLNDIEAGLGTGVHFIGFAVDETRRRKLKSAGAAYIAATHAQSLELIRWFLGR